MNYYERIAELIFRNVKSSLNKDFVEELIQIIIEEEALEEYMTTQTKELLLDPGCIIYQTMYKEDAPYVEAVPKSNYSQEYYDYLYATRLTLTELEKRRLRKELEEGTTENLQNYILNEYLTQCKKLDAMKIYQKNIRMGQPGNPEERYADIFTYDILLKVSELLQEEEIYNIHRLELCDVLIRTYRALLDGLYMGGTGAKTSPTLCYLKQLGCEERVLKEIQQKSQDLEDIEKLKLGLEISKSTGDKICSEQGRLKRALHINK